MLCMSDDSFSNDVEQLIPFYAPANDITALFFFFFFPLLIYILNVKLTLCLHVTCIPSVRNKRRLIDEAANVTAITIITRECIHTNVQGAHNS